MSSKRERAVVGTPVVIDPATQTQEFQSGKFSPGSADGKRGSGEVVGHIKDCKRCCCERVLISNAG